MKFIHIADVHLGAEPEGLKAGGKNRGKEIWDALEQIVNICEWEEIDLLLIAGDLFHRQPLMRELKEVNFLFSKLSKTRVVFIVGNHDYLKPDSYYHTFQWNENVYPLLNGHMGGIEFPDLQTNVYGLSYHQREITEGLYDRMFAPKKQKYEILLAHGGDEKHIPVKKEVLETLGYDYIALGHIHKPQVLIENKAVYAGSLEPTDKNDIGKHGYVRGDITEQGVGTEFIPCAKREYIHAVVPIEEGMTGGALKDWIRNYIGEHGLENMYKFILQGFRDADVQFDLESAKSFGNVFEVVDETNPSYDFEKILEKNQGNLLGRYIESLKDYDKGSVEYQALHLGVQALMETKRG
ncbi:MAG: DNA repair exonuclease [Tyzzerella sp.]|nr:DNA repair exonuclease [Tyzzerella sp.]